MCEHVNFNDCTTTGALHPAMYGFTEADAGAPTAHTCDDDGFGGVLEDDGIATRSADAHKLESERAWGLMSDQFTNVRLSVPSLFRSS